MRSTENRVAIILSGGGYRDCLNPSAQSRVLSRLCRRSIPFPPLPSAVACAEWVTPSVLIKLRLSIANRAMRFLSPEKSNAFLHASFAGLNGVFPHAYRAIEAGR